MRTTRARVVSLVFAFMGPCSALIAQVPPEQHKHDLEAERTKLQDRIQAIDAELAALRAAATTAGVATGYEATSDLIAHEVLQAPYEYALPVRLGGRPWSVEPGQRLAIVGAVKKSLDGYWRVSDGTHAGYFSTLGTKVFKSGQELSKYREEDQALEALAGGWTDHLVELVRNRSLVVFGVFPNGPDSASGVGVRVIWRHLETGRVVKYVTFTVIPYNAVGDTVTDRLSGQAARKLRATGPFDARPPLSAEYDEESSWDAQWYNSTISCIHLARVDVEYMDGTSKSYTGNLGDALSAEFQNECVAR